MQEICSTILAGVFISLTGSLPLGNLNVTATHLAAKESARSALWFAVGAVLVEMIYLRLTLSVIDSVLLHSSLFLKLQWATVVLLLALAAGSFWALRKPAHESKNILIENRMNRFVLGFLMSLANPVQLPFWAGWSTYLLAQQWIAKSSFGYNLFTLAAGAGTFGAMLAFIFVGRRFADLMNRNQKPVHWIMGMLFLSMAVLQLWHLLAPITS